MFNDRMQSVSAISSIDSDFQFQYGMRLWNIYIYLEIWFMLLVINNSLTMGYLRYLKMSSMKKTIFLNFRKKQNFFKCSSKQNNKHL